MSAGDMSDGELERELMARAERRGFRFVATQRADDTEWRAAFMQPDDDPDAEGVLVAHSSDRRTALEHLYTIDEQDREAQQRRRPKR